MLCSLCGKSLNKRTKSGFCSSCINIARAKQRFNLWLETGDLGISVGTTLRGHLREELLNYYGNKCSICGCPNVWNDKELVFILDHINGDASDNSKENLRFVCPNCDSQLETYKSKNKNSARSFRRLYYGES